MTTFLAPTPPLPEGTAVSALRNAVSAVIRGKDEVIELALTALVAGGHLLIEDIPGVGKSTLARALACAVGGEFHRVQFTSDLLPADLLGVNVWISREERFEFRRGPLFGNIVLADEINRAPPRTQSALLEAMEEGQVSVDGTSRTLPSPFMVIATQNPEEHHGTYPLPESQRDRFLLRLSMGYTDAVVEAELLARPPSRAQMPSAPVVSLNALLDAQQRAQQVSFHQDLAAYAQRVVAATREHATIRLGVSTRGAIGWVRAARAQALLGGRDRVAIDDLQDLAVPALAHRIVSTQAATGGQSGVAADLIREIIATVPVPT